jgi:hypothetical protein
MEFHFSYSGVIGVWVCYADELVTFDAHNKLSAKPRFPDDDSTITVSFRFGKTSFFQVLKQAYSSLYLDRTL